jgi:hypothetical protein
MGSRGEASSSSRRSFPATRILVFGFVLAIGSPGRADDPPAAAPDSAAVAAAREAHLGREKAFRDRVNLAIGRGRAWLASKQAADGTWGAYATRAHAIGLTSLCLQTLATCGADERDPHVKAGLKLLDATLTSPPHVMTFENTPGGVVFTYGAATTILFFEALYRADASPAGARATVRLPKARQAQVRALVDWLSSSQKVDGWRYPYGNAEGDVDLSNTVYALLGLQAAAHCGVDAAPDVYDKALAYLLTWQEKRGDPTVRWLPNAAYQPWVAGSPFVVDGGEDHARGWAYTPARKIATGSMTTAGVTALAVIRDRLSAAKHLGARNRSSIDQAMLDGIAELGARFDVHTNPGPDGLCWQYYYLYGLERAGALTGLPNFGRHDWYREGAELILDQMRPDGSWPAPPPPAAWIMFQPDLVQTCFALLFLKRGTIPPAEPIGSTLTKR